VTLPWNIAAEGLSDSGPIRSPRPGADKVHCMQPKPGGAAGSGRLVRGAWHPKSSWLPGIGRSVAVAVVLVVLAAGWSLHASVAGGPGNASTREVPGFSAPNCTGMGWHTTHLWVGTDGCQPLFTVMYSQNFSFWNTTNLYAQYNFSFILPWVAEVSPTGQLVRLAEPWVPQTLSAAVTSSGDEVNISVREVVNVTNASGTWEPINTWPVMWTPWNVTGPPIGTTTLAVVFHLFNVTGAPSANVSANASYSAKFDVGVSGWPWASASDVLGFGLESIAAGGAHYSFDTASHTLAESWNSTNSTFVSLVLGGFANTSYSSALSALATIGQQVGIYTTNSVDREVIALVTFGNVSGNYSSVQYDPWVVFSPYSTPPPSQSSGPGLPAWGTVVIASVVLVIGVATGAGWYVRGHRLRGEGEELVQGMRSALREAPEPPGRSR
jgi:hypothetical protein